MQVLPPPGQKVRHTRPAYCGCFIQTNKALAAALLLPGSDPPPPPPKLAKLSNLLNICCTISRLNLILILNESRLVGLTLILEEGEGEEAFDNEKEGGVQRECGWERKQERDMNNLSYPHGT